MRHRPPRALVASLALALSCAPRAADQPAPAPPTPLAPRDAVPDAAAARSAPASRAPVVVTIVIDQMASWIAAERWPKLPDTGGLARLRREGTWARDVRYEHAVTDTGPGHASLYTGATPRVSGIFANEVLSPSRERVTVLGDASTRVVSADGDRDGATSSSASAIRADTVADRLRAVRPDAVIVSVSMKDRAAIPGGGRHPTASLWLGSPPNEIVTSSAFASAFPAWARERGGSAGIAALRAWTWEPLDPAWLRANADTDAARGAPDAGAALAPGDLGGMGPRFPHDVARAAPASFRATPRGDDLLLGLALAALDAEATRPERPVLLALSLSANDYIGHVFGPDAPEAWDELLRLDAALARFFAALDARFGAAGYAVVLAADHGVGPAPELQSASRAWCAAGAPRDPWDRPCAAGRRIDPDALAIELRAAARRALGAGDYVDGVVDPYVILSAEARALPAAKRATLDRALRDALTKHREIAYVIALDRARAAPSEASRDAWRTAAGLAPGDAGRSLRGPAKGDASREAIEALVHESVSDGAIGEYYLVPGRGSFFDTLYVPGHGTSHGTPYVYDRSVPLLVRAPGRVQAGAVVTEPTSFRAFARAASELLAIAPPDSTLSAPSFIARTP